MFKNATEKFCKFYDIDFGEKSNSDEIFDVLGDIINFDNAGIFYIASNTLKLEYGKGFEGFETIKINNILSEKLYDNNCENIEPEIKNLIDKKSEFLVSKMKIKGTLIGVIIISRNGTTFLNDEKIIFKTCGAIITDLIKDKEISNILKLQISTTEEKIKETRKAYETIKKQNKKIKDNEKIQNKFIANVSHDLRTPLNSVIGFSDILLNKIFGNLNEKQTEYINNIKISGIRLLEMINEILDISKLEYHCIKPNFSNFDIKILTDEVCNILKPLYEKKNIKIIKNIDASENITGDYIKLQQVMFNIIGNSIKFSHENSEIIIDISQTKTDTTIKIKDFGLGIDKKYHKKIFNKFFRVENIKRTEPSTGLGLTVAKEFVKLHNGTITVTSEKDKGAEFTITLPKNLSEI